MRRVLTVNNCKLLKWIFGRKPVYVYAVLIFGFAEAVVLFGVVAPWRIRVELLCNALMLVVAVIGLFRAKEPAKGSTPNNPDTILTNVAIPIIALSMNIDVFGHTIRREQLWNDLWGWHLCWIICAVVQMMLFSSLGMRLLIEIQQFFRWVKKLR